VSIFALLTSLLGWTGEEIYNSRDYINIHSTLPGAMSYGPSTVQIKVLNYFQLFHSPISLANAINMSTTDGSIPIVMPEKWKRILIEIVKPHSQ